MTLSHIRVLLNLPVLLVLIAACASGRETTETPSLFLPVTPGQTDSERTSGLLPTETLPPLPELDVPTPPPTLQTRPTAIAIKAGGAPVTFEGVVAPPDAHRYVLPGGARQILDVDLTLSHGLAILVIWGEDGTVLISDRPAATEWRGSLPTTQYYYIDVKPLAGRTQVSYRLEISLASAP